MIGILATIILSAIVAMLIDSYKKEIKTFFKGMFGRDE